MAKPYCSCLLRRAPEEKKLTRLHPAVSFSLMMTDTFRLATQVRRLSLLIPATGGNLFPRLFHTLCRH